MKTKLVLKLLQKINTDEFLKQELENLFGKDAIPSMFTSFTDEQFEDLLKSKDTRQILYKIYMYVKGDKLPQELKKLVDDKIARRGCFIHTACDMLYMFNNEELLKREDIHQIFELIINAPLPKRDYIVNAFKEVDLSKRDNIVEFINIILTANGKEQAEYASKVYVAIMKKINHHEEWSIYNTDSFYYKACRELYDRNKKNVIPITRIIANRTFGFDAEYVYNFVIEKSKERTPGIKFWHSDVAAWPEIIEIIEELLSAKGIEQTKILEETYKKMVDKLYNYREHRFGNPGQLEPVIKSSLLGVIGDAVGPVQAQAVADYLLSITDFQDEETILKNATTIANWFDDTQIKDLIKWFGYDTALWEKYASQITFWENENKKDILTVIIKFHKKYKQFDLGNLIKALSKIGENIIVDRNSINSIIYVSRIYQSQYFLRYIETLLKTKDKLTYCLVAGYMTGLRYKHDLENIPDSYIVSLVEQLYENKNQIQTILNILEETGIGFITNFDNEESVKMVERLVSSQQPIEVTLKELMKLPADVVAPVLEGAPDEIEPEDKIFIIKPNTIKEMNNED